MEISKVVEVGARSFFSLAISDEGYWLIHAPAFLPARKDNQYNTAEIFLKS
jgi:hypothetical protein